MNELISKWIIGFYKIWHGRFHQRGAGKLINCMAPRLSGLQRFPLRMPNGTLVEVDFRELSAFGWLNTMLGEEYQETPLITSLCKYLEPDSVFWDIGANAGVLSYKVSDLVKLHEHHYFEPNPKLYKWATAALSHLKNVKGHQTALSDQSGDTTLYIPVNRSAFGSLNKAENTEVEEIHVKMATGDSLVFEQGLRPPDVMKIDTEGHEVEVLKGMTRLLQMYRPIIFFEHIEITDLQIESILPTGYEVRTVSNSTGELTSNFERSAGHNSVFLPIS